MKKKLNIWTILLIISGVFVSCDLESLADKEIDSSTSHSFTVTVQNGQKSFGKTEIISINNNDVKDYLDKIKSVEIRKMTYQITNFSGDANCTINSFKAYLGEELALNDADINPKEASDNGTVFEVKNAEVLNNAGTKLKNNQSISVMYNGTATSTDASQFQIKVNITVVVVANPLE